jgi:NitT/TauT family transport system substrate-binding protein
MSIAIHSKMLRRIMAAIAVICVSATVMAGCAANENSASGDAGSQAVNYQLSWLKISQFDGLFAAQMKHYYADEKLNVKFTAGGSNMVSWQQITSGKALVGDDDNTLLLQAIAKGEPLVVIGTVFQSSPLAIMSKSDKPIKTAKDLKGKTIAIPDNAKEQFQKILSKAGLNDSDVKFVPAGSDPNQLVTDQVDGYVGYSTSQGAPLELKGLHINYLNLSDLGIPSYANVIITTRDNIKNHRAELVKFLRATVKGFTYLQDNPKEVSEYLVNTVNPAGGLDLKTEQKVAELQQPLMKSDKGYLYVDKGRMQEIIDSLVEVGTLTKKLNANDFVDMSLLEEATKQ